MRLLQFRRQTETSFHLETNYKLKEKFIFIFILKIQTDKSFIDYLETLSRIIIHKWYNNKIL